ncbi:MAG: GNAT family N-acetyltransferase [Bacteroidales bacterium]
MIKIIDCDFENPNHCRAVIDLMKDYMTDEMGGELDPHSPETANKMIEGLKNHPSKLVLLAELQGELIGLTNSFINYGTFAAKPFINIHDIVVLKKFRSAGVGKKLMEANIKRAKELGCGKITLEVREDNIKARGLYRNFGFEEHEPVMHFWTKTIESKL